MSQSRYTDPRFEALTAVTPPRDPAPAANMQAPQPAARSTTGQGSPQQ